MKLTLKDFKTNSTSIEVEFVLSDSLYLTFTLPHSLSYQERNQLKLRKDELWKSTCFECFIQYKDRSYDEWNFDLEGNWQSYSFTSYRSPNPPVPSNLSPLSYLLKDQKLTINIPFTKKKEVVALSPTVILEGNQFFAHRHPEKKADFHLEEYFFTL